MDPSQSDHNKQEDASGEDTAIMLFGKQIKSLSSAEKIKEELSPRGVDEKGLSFATSSDDEEDLYPATDFSMQVTPTGSMSASETSKEHARKRKATESGCMDGLDDDTEEPKSTAGNTTPVMMGGGEHADAEQQLKSGLWSRCPRCSSADTKFCYFNNYNVNQPRHFCKHCQRYWTAGGTLRNVPIGAGKRKNKHTLHKNGFVTNFPSAGSIPTPSLPPLGVSDTHPLPMAKSELLSTSGSGAISVMKTDLVNTNLELSTHNPFTDARTSSLPPCNFIHPHSAHKLVTLQQLQENPQSRLSQANPHSHECCTNYGQFYPNLDCGHSSLSPINPNLACGQSSLGQGLHNMEATHHLNPSAHNELYKLSQICPHLRGGCPVIPQICPESQSECPRLTQIYPELQRGCADFARPSTQLQSELCNLCHTCPHVPSGSCRTERGLSEVDEVKRIVENGLPTSDQKSKSLERGLPDMVRIASEEPKKVSSLQIRHPKMGPDEEDKCMQWFKEKSTTVCGALVSCKADMKGSCHGLVGMKATPPYLLQHNNAQTSSTSSTLVSKSKEASNVDNLMTRGGEGQNNLLNVWGSLWPCFYNMLWLDPLALSHVNPILTPQGWALPFIQPSVHKVESAYSTYSNTSPTTNISKNLDSTRTHINTPAALVAPFEDISTSTSNVSTGSPRKPVLPPARTSPQPH